VRDDQRGPHSVELQQYIRRAAKLERAPRLQVLALEEHAPADTRVERVRAHDRCAHDVRANARGRRHDIGKPGHGGHGCALFND
jgi:hypothetical protein